MTGVFELFEHVIRLSRVPTYAPNVLVRSPFRTNLTRRTLSLYKRPISTLPFSARSTREWPKISATGRR